MNDLATLASPANIAAAKALITPVNVALVLVAINALAFAAFTT